MPKSQPAKAPDENIYVRLPTNTVTRLDVKCAELRIKRPAAILLAVEAWLEENGDAPRPIKSVAAGPALRKASAAAEKAAKAVREIQDVIAVLGKGKG